MLANDHHESTVTVTDCHEEHHDTDIIISNPLSFIDNALPDIRPEDMVTYTDNNNTQEVS
jgi:hypothetical protein